MITKNDLETGKEFKLKHDTGVFLYYSHLKMLGYFKLGKKDSYFDVVEFNNEGFHIANPYVEGVFIYYEFNQFDLCTPI